MRSFPAVLLPVVVLFALVSCSGSEQPDDAAASTSARPSGQSSPSSAPGTSSPPSASDPPGGASPGQVPRPDPGSCEPVPESSDGRYVVADAGEITLRLGTGALQLEVSSSGGWSTSVDSDDDEADVEFRRGDDELDFRADLENGRLVLQICDD